MSRIGNSVYPRAVVMENYATAFNRSPWHGQDVNAVKETVQKERLRKLQLLQMSAVEEQSGEVIGNPYFDQLPVCDGKLSSVATMACNAHDALC